MVTGSFPRRFAEMSVSLYGREGVFTISCADDEEREAVSVEFYRLGAIVTRDECRCELTVICPLERQPSRNERAYSPLSNDDPRGAGLSELMWGENRMEPYSVASLGSQGRSYPYVR